MNRKELSQNYWKYYLMLERRFIKTIEYVELNEKNFSTFSNEYAHLIQVIGAELDTFFKEFCNLDFNEFKKISDYADVILNLNPEIKDNIIIVKDYDIEIQPFKDWDLNSPGKSLFWWTAFTDIKHNRYLKIEQANQINVLNIFGALYLLEMLFLKKNVSDGSDLDIFDESSNLFIIKGYTTRYINSKNIYLNKIND